MDKLPRNPKEFRRKLVDSKKELDELWERLTKNTKELEPKADMRYGLPIYRRELDMLMLINTCHIDKLDEILFINTPNPTYISEYINVVRQLFLTGYIDFGSYCNDDNHDKIDYPNNLSYYK